MVAKLVAASIAGSTVGVIAISASSNTAGPNAVIAGPIALSYNTSADGEGLTTVPTEATTTTPMATQPTTTSTSTTVVSTTETTTTTVATTVETTTEVKETSTTETVASVETEETKTEEVIVSGPQKNHITKHDGIGHAPNGFLETYYDLPMSGVVSNMRGRGYSEEEYPYWVDEVRGTKMLGPYIMVAADIDQVYCYRYGDIVETDLGTGIVCDTGGFRFSNAAKYDIATAWDSGFLYPGYNTDELPDDLTDDLS